MTDVAVAVPVLDLTADLLDPGATLADVTVGLPALTLTLTAPAAHVGSTPLNILTAKLTLMDADGLTPIGVLRSQNVKWHNEQSRAGTLDFETPLDDAMTFHIRARRIVRATFYRAGVPVVVGACIIESEGVELAYDGVRWLKFSSQPGLLSMLADAAVEPEYGINKHSPDERMFGWPSISGPWRTSDSANWITPRGVRMSDDVGRRHGHPPELKKTNPYWIAATDPSTSGPTGTTNYYRAHLDLAAGKYVDIVWATDNYGSLYLDGEEIGSPDYTNPLTWLSAQRLTMHLPAGDHLFAAKVENAALAHPPGYNPMGLVFACYELNDKGQHVGVLLESNTSDWAVHDNTPEPGWFRPQILLKLLQEAQALGIDGPSRIRAGFTYYHDSRGAHHVNRVNKSFPVGTQNLYDVTDELTERDMNVYLEPTTMTLKEWGRAGKDRRATVELKLPKDDPVNGNILSQSVTVTHARFTSVLTKRADGTWLETRDAAGVASTTGLVRAAVSLGSAESDFTAAASALTFLAESAQAQLSVTFQITTTAGPQPYQQLHMGDTFTGPGYRDGTPLAYRLLGITLDTSASPPTAFLEVVQDRSTP